MLLLSTKAWHHGIARFHALLCINLSFSFNVDEGSRLDRRDIKLLDIDIFYAQIWLKLEAKQKCIFG